MKVKMIIFNFLVTPFYFAFVAWSKLVGLLLFLDVKYTFNYKAEGDKNDNR